MVETADSLSIPSSVRSFAPAVLGPLGKHHVFLSRKPQFWVFLAALFRREMICVRLFEEETQCVILPAPQSETAN